MARGSAPLFATPRERDAPSMSTRKEQAMLTRIGLLTARHPWRVMIVWLVAAVGLAGYAAANQSSVTTNDTSTFLPSNYESAEATKLGQREFGMAKGATVVTALVRRA